MSSSSKDNVATKRPDFFTRLCTNQLFLAVNLPQLVAAQAPVSDLTGYPSGLASAAVVCYYEISSDADNLTHQRRLAGFGAEHIFRDLGTGCPRKRDSKVKGIFLSRYSGNYQRTSWAWRYIGRLPGGPSVELNVPFVTREKLLKDTALAFADLPAMTKAAVQAPAGFGCAGHWLAGMAAFCQVVERLSGGHNLLMACALKQNDITILRQHYEVLEDFVSGQTNEVEVPDIRDKPLTDLENLYVRADTWEGGGRPVYINCSIFLQMLGHCVGFTYGELMAGAHRYLPQARWADDLFIHFKDELDATATEEQLTRGIKETLAVSIFHQRECDIRVWGHRFGDLMASIVAGCLIGSLVSVGSTCGTWVTVTAAAIADPKPVAGLACAAWGYPMG